MAKIKQIQQQMADVKLLQELTSTFESIAAQNLASTRQKVLDARVFLEDARNIYNYSREIFIRRHKLKDRKLYHEQLTVRPDNGRHLSVIVAPNTKLYGSLPDQLLNTATEEIRQDPRDVLVLGKVGVEHFSRLRPPIPFFTLDVEDEDYSPEQLKDVVAIMSRYRKVTAYYNHFRTVLTADVLAAELTLSAPSGEVNMKEQHDEAEFEPSLEEVLNFFETIILKTLLRQKVHESMLSRYAARMVAMDVATENAKKETKRLNRDLIRAKRLKQNAKMLDSYSGMTLWRN